MKFIIYTFLVLTFCPSAYANDSQLETYITSFDYAARKEMKMDSKGLIELLKQGKAQLIDIRFP